MDQHVNAAPTHAEMLEAEAASPVPGEKTPAERIADALETHNGLMLQVLDKLEALEMSLRPR